MEVRESSKAEDVSARHASNPEPHLASWCSPEMNPVTGLRIYGSVRPFQVQRRVLTRGRRQLRQPAGGRENQFAPRVSVPLSGPTGAHFNPYNG